MAGEVQLKYVTYVELYRVRGSDIGMGQDEGHRREPKERPRRKTLPQRFAGLPGRAPGLTGELRCPIGSSVYHLGTGKTEGGVDADNGRES